MAAIKELSPKDFLKLKKELAHISPSQNQPAKNLPIEMTLELKELSQNPAFQRMLKYSFIGSKERVKEETIAFFEKTRVNELMVVSNMYHHEDRVKSFRIFSEIMTE